MKYCNNCRQFVEPQKKFNWCVFILLCFTMFGWFLYLIYYFAKKKKCPMCQSTNWGVKPPESPQQTPTPVIISQQTSASQMQPNAEEFKFCNQCGEKIGKNVQFCSSCGAKQ